MSTTTKEKWFYGLQSTVVHPRFDILYTKDWEGQSLFQVVTKDRVLEQWRIITPEAETKDVMVSMIKRENGRHTVIIYELNFVGSD